MIHITAIIPRGKLPQLDKAIRKSRDEVAAELNKKFAITHSTWKHTVTFNTNKSGDNAVKVFTTDKPYFFVNVGTKVRRALMSPDFVAKSKPNKLAQGAGRGRVIYISRNIKRPGIKARNFDKIIAKDIQPFMIKALTKNLRSL